MPGGMPYWLEKGPALSVFESYLKNPANKIGVLKHMLTDKAVLGVDVYKDKDLTKYGTKEHLKKDWFTPKTAFWNEYAGENVAEICRHGYIQALAISLGIDDPYAEGFPTDAAGAKAVAGRATRCLPLSLHWKCGQSWFECWVTWNDGGVALMFATPSDTTPVGQGYVGVEEVAIPADPATVNDQARATWLALGRGSGFAAERLTRDQAAPRADTTGTAGQTCSMLRGGPAGMLVVTHQENRLVTPPQVPKPFVRPGVDDPPAGAVYTGKGDIVVVSPSEVWGGIKPDGGRKYEPI